MARHRFGLTSADWAFTVAIDGLTPQLAASATFTLWNALSSGTQYTDLTLDAAGLEPITFITASDGSDGYLAGTVEFAYGPDGVREMYIDGGVGGRLLITANDVGADLDDLLARVEALENVASNNAALLALVMVMNLEDTGTSTYLTRPALAGSRIVGWVGDDTPSVGAGGLVDRDLYFDTAP